MIWMVRSSDEQFLQSLSDTEAQQDVEMLGEPGGNRTRDHRIKSAMLYQLSYRPDKNPRCACLRITPDSIPASRGALRGDGARRSRFRNLRNAQTISVLSESILENNVSRKIPVN